MRVDVDMSSVPVDPNTTAKRLIVVTHVTWADHRPSFWHQCKDGASVYRLNPDRWQWDEVNNTITPSINCTLCESHGFWTEGEWIPV